MGDENTETSAETQTETTTTTETTTSAADTVAEMAGGETTTTTTERPEHVPEKFWDAEKGEARVEDVFKSYSELEKRFGSFTGAPEDDYVVGISDELKEKGVEINAEDPVLQEAMKIGKEMGLSQEGFNKFIEIQAMGELARHTAEQEAITTDIASLGDDADRRLNNLGQWASKNLPEDLQEGFKDAAVSADAVKAIEQLVSMTRSAPVQANEAAAAPSISKEEVETMHFAKDEQGNRKIQVDPAFKAEYERKRDLVYGTEPHHTTVG